LHPTQTPINNSINSILAKNIIFGLFDFVLISSLFPANKIFQNPGYWVIDGVWVCQKMKKPSNWVLGFIIQYYSQGSSKTEKH